MEVNMLDFTNTTNDWNFETVKEPVMRPNGQVMENIYNLVRTDTDEVLHTHNNSYTILSHDDAVNAAYDAVKEADISQDFSVDIKCMDSGRKLKGTILFNDLTIEPQEGDHVKLRMDFFNSYDASWAYANQLAGLRLVCTNGMVSPQAIAKVWARHTANINVQASVSQIAQGMDTFLHNKEQWQQWMKVKVSRDQAEALFKDTVVKRRTKATDERYNAKQLEVLLGQLDTEFSTLGKNKWALYNCLTHWSSHTEASKTPEIAQRSREAKVASAMNSKQWLAIA
jgi:hypothetical protein